MTNVNDPVDGVNEEPGYRFGRLRLGRALGAQKLGASVYELPAGERTWPYHWHHGNEELAIVLSGEVVLRQPDGERILRVGDAVAFPAGRDGAHMFRNDSDSTARVVLVSTSLLPDMTEYPDSGKIGLFGTESFGRPDYWREMWVPVSAEVDYYEGERLEPTAPEAPGA